jgi:hypothetical protein
LEYFRPPEKLEFRSPKIQTFDLFTKLGLIGNLANAISAGEYLLAFSENIEYITLLIKPYLSFKLN